MSDGIEAHLRAACVDLRLSDAQLAQLAQHWRLLLRWNARINLTRITAPVEAAWLHYRDSLAALPYLGASPVVDLGSGGGFPGVPCAVALPALAFTLVEPRRKRASFLRTVAAELGLANVDVLELRHDAPPPRHFSAALTRATFSDRRELEACRRWLVPGGVLVTYRSEPWRGAPPDETVRYRLRDEPRLLAIWRS